MSVQYIVCWNFHENHTLITSLISWVQWFNVVFIVLCNTSCYQGMPSYCLKSISNMYIYQLRTSVKVLYIHLDSGFKWVITIHLWWCHMMAWLLQSLSINSFFNNLFRLTMKKKHKKLHITGICEGIWCVTGRFSSQRASIPESISVA